MITTLLNIENVATMVCRVPGKEELGGASVGLESWDMDERSEEHTSELQSHSDLVCRLLLETKKHTSELQSHSDLVCRLLLETKKNISLLCSCMATPRSIIPERINLFHINDVPCDSIHQRDI